MKIRKLLVTLLAVVMAIGVATALTACAPTEEKNPDNKPGNEKSFQLTGSFTDDLGPMGKGFEFMLNLNTDLTAVLARYSPYSYDHSDAATNKSYNAEFMKGTWKEAKKDGVDCLQIKLACVGESGKETDNVTVYSYEVAGTYSADVSFPIVPGMSYKRTVSMSGSATKTYADGNAFIQAKKMTFVAPESVTTFVATSNMGTATLYVQAEGKVAAYLGYNEIASGTYSKTDSEIKVILNDTPATVTVDGNKGSFIYAYNMGYGDDIQLNFVCEDITKIPAFGPADFEPVNYTGTFKGTEYKMTLTSPTACKYSTKMGGYEFGFDGTYTVGKDDKVIAFTIGEEPTNQQLLAAWNGMKNIVWTLDEVNKTMTGMLKYTSATTFTVKNPMNQSDMQAHLVIGITDESNCKFFIAEFGGMLGSFDCTYTLEGDTITLTLKGEEPTEGMNVGFWTVMKETLSWTLNADMTMAVVTAAA